MYILKITWDNLKQTEILKCRHKKWRSWQNKLLKRFIYFRKWTFHFFCTSVSILKISSLILNKIFLIFFNNRILNFKHFFLFKWFDSYGYIHKNIWYVKIKCIYDNLIVHLYNITSVVFCKFIVLHDSLYCVWSKEMNWTLHTSIKMSYVDSLTWGTPPFMLFYIFVIVIFVCLLLMLNSLVVKLIERYCFVFIVIIK